MNRTRILSVVATGVVALAFSAVPAQAQHRGSGGHSGGARAAAAAPRSAPGAAVPRGGVTGGAVPRSGVVGPYYGGRFYGRGFGYVLGSPYYAFRPWVSLGYGLSLGYPVAYPYWAFPSPYVYGYPYYSYPGYGYPYPGYGYGYGSGYPASGPTYGTAPSAESNTVTAESDTTASEPNTSTAQANTGGATAGQYGGLSFQITPANASVLVDAVYVGTVNQFTPTTQPLTVTAGRHHVELRAEGFAPLTFDVNVAPGQVMPYQGTMQAK
jgi:hypothetical protein